MMNINVIQICGIKDKKNPGLRLLCIELHFTADQAVQMNHSPADYSMPPCG